MVKKKSVIIPLEASSITAIETLCTCTLVSSLSGTSAQAERISSVDQLLSKFPHTTYFSQTNWLLNVNMTEWFTDEGVRRQCLRLHTHLPQLMNSCNGIREINSAGQ